MRNIWFTIFSFQKYDDKYRGLRSYRTLLEILMISAIQDKINRDKKVHKYMLMFYPDLELDDVKYFKELFYEKNVRDGILNLSISTKGIEWNALTDVEKKEFLIDKWKVLFNNLSDDYFVVDKSEIIDALEALRKEKWKHTSLLFKKNLKYNKESYSIVLDISVEIAKLALVREYDDKWFILKEYEEVWNIMIDGNFKNFKLIEDTLKLENKTFFLPAEVFNLKEILN